MRKIHKDLIKSLSEGDFGGARPKPGDLIIGDKLLRKFMPPQLGNTIYRHKVFCVCEICIPVYVIKY